MRNKLPTTLTIAAIVQVFFVTSSVSTREVVLIAPSIIRALSYDVTVVVVQPYKGLIVELYYEDEKVPLTGQIIAQLNQRNEAGLVFNCGYFSKLGKYQLKIFDEAKRKNLNVSKVIEVKEWPVIKLETKQHHEAFTTDVQVVVKTSDNICSSYVSKQLQTKLEIVKDNGEILTESSSNFPPPSHIFQCHVFNNEGKYFAQLLTIDDVIIARSDVISVKWSNEYQLNVEEKLLPCKGGIKVKVETPPCYSHYDVIQAALLDNNGNFQVLQNISLGTEGDVTFPCSILSSSSPSVCFRYVTSSGFVVRTICRILNRTKDLRINGAWSMWTSWEKCSRKCNYLTTRRARVCNNPLARGVGKGCDSEGSLYAYEFHEDKQKPATGCPLLFGTPTHNASTPDCKCGCYVHVDSNNYLSSLIPGQCKGKNRIEWKLYASPEFVIKLHVVDFQLSYGEYLTVVDGHGSTTSMTSQGQLMTSQSNIVNIEYMRINTVEPFQSCGFVIEYSIQEKNETLFMTSQPPNTEVIVTDNADWLVETMKNPVTMGAIGACLLIICIVSIVAILRCRRQCRKRQQSSNLVVRRLTTPPDGKSCSNFDGESDRQSPVGENTSCNPDVTMKPRTEYYLAQRQLQLMKKLGKDNLHQTYDASCINKTIVQEQEELLFGDLNNAHSQPATS